jgi:gliding motility-associated-like protein
LKHNNLKRIRLIGCLLSLCVIKGSAQTGGYSNLEFVENRGQWDTAVKFRAEMSSGAFFLGKKGFTVLLHDTTDLKNVAAMQHGAADRGLPVGKTTAGARTTPGSGTASAAGKSPAIVTARNIVIHSHSYRVSFDGANENVEIVPDKALPTYNNYFIGDDRSKWASNCKVYQGVIYKNIYEGIDLHYYTDAGSLKYDLIVHPGADPDQITLKYEGQDQLSVKKNQLFVRTSVGVVREWIPRSYQLSEIEKKDVECRYFLSEGNKIKLAIKNYSHDATLVIDPTEVFCSFTGSTSDNWGYTATYDAAGNFYAGGIVLADEAGQPDGNGFKTLGAYQSSYQGGDGSEGGFEYDVAIMKFSSNGVNRLYATYLGGNGNEQPHSMVVDNSGNLIVAGRTSSKNFPHTYANYGSGDSLGTFDIFLTKFNAAGNNLIGSRRIGGRGDDGVNYSPKYVSTNGTQNLRLNYGDDGRSEVIIDNNDNIYLASCTQSTDFPVTPGVFQTISGGKQDGVLIKTSPDLSTILFSSYIGGNGDDAAFVLALSPVNNDIYVAGGTMSNNLQGTGNGPVLYPATSGGVHGFVSIISNDGSTLIKTSYFKATDASVDIIYGIEIDKNGYPYITGTTTGSWPMVQAAWSQPGGKQFISKLKPDLSNWVYSTVFGKANNPYPDLSITAFLVDRCENVYVAGWGGGIDISEHYNNSGTSGLVTTSNAIKPTTDGSDFYFFVLRRDAVSQLYGTYFGQTNGSLGDHVDGGTSRFDKNGIIYEAICANCYGGARFPTTTGVWAASNGTTQGGRVLGCNEAAVKIAFNFAGVGDGVKAALSGRGDSLGCIPLNAFLQDTIRDAKSYIWDFGDGSPKLTTTSYKENHIYTAVGTYRVTLVAIDSTSCNIADTAYMNITARSDKAILDFKWNKVGGCMSQDFDFTNFSSPSPGKPFGNSSFVWEFGDNTAPSLPTGTGDVTHSYGTAGSYNVSLILIDSNYCNYPDTLTKLLGIAQNVKAQFVTPASGCAPYLANIQNTSIAGQQYYWDFGDGTVDSADRTPPPHYYADTGTYTITLRVVDSSTCNITDNAQFTIHLIGKPASDFSSSPVLPVPNTPIVFTNESSKDAVRFKWLFGDGSSESTNTRDTAVHQYNVTGTFNACLVAINPNGCADTVCHDVQTLVNPLLDVPNAFTPGRFGENGIVKVVGFGITHMIFRIYNRWGQLLFESDDPVIGWDGTFKGVVQPMDVYAYTLEAEFSDGTRTVKKGNITLIR